MIWATDGSPDMFRIQITDSTTGAIVYDNGVQQPIGGGSSSSTAERVQFVRST
ncbi:MAG TPA: hypothetical protein VNF71_07780 [Acidimicrobiales bacterium]|nr:hypothetical protein [Acidimicrobiales bacterium]